MDNSLLKQILHEYDKKRTQAILEAEKRKKELLEENPKLAEIEQQLKLQNLFLFQSQKKSKNF